MAALRTALAAVLLFVLSEGTVAQSSPPADVTQSPYGKDDGTVPATLSFSTAGGIEEAISFPDTQGDISVVLICGLQFVEIDRVPAWNNTCFGRSGNTGAFEQAFREAMPSLTVSGGRVNGTRRRLWIPYSVEFTKRGEDERIRLYSNYGTEISRYGRYYSAPQRILPKRAPNVFRTCRIDSPGEVVWVTANITADGMPEDVRILAEVSDACRKRLEITFVRSSFIPAFHEGRPVPAVFSEPFYVLP